jgi:hypothetical protein
MMGVREGGSYTLDPKTGELTRNPPADAGGTEYPKGRSGTAREAPSAGSGPDDPMSSGGAEPAALNAIPEALPAAAPADPASDGAGAPGGGSRAEPSAPRRKKED